MGVTEQPATQQKGDADDADAERPRSRVGISRDMLRAAASLDTGQQGNVCDVSNYRPVVLIPEK